MKKRALFLAMVAALVAFAACNKEAAGPLSEEGAVEAVFEVSAPELATKAISDGLTADQLFFFLYDKEGKLLFNTNSSVSPADNAYPVTFDKLGDKKWSVKVRLIKGMTYKLAFWAQKEMVTGNPFSFDADGEALTVHYENVTMNSDNYDAFWGTVGVDSEFIVTGPATKVVTLKRPFAQLNVAIPAEDLAVAAFTLDKYDHKSADNIITQYSISGEALPTKMTLLSGAVSGTAESPLILPEAKQPKADIVIGDKIYKHMAMAYVLVGGKVTNDVTLTVETGAAAIGDNGKLTRTILNVPLQRNYRTNIIGNIFSVEEEFTVEVDNAFGETGTGAYGDVHVPDYVPTFGSIEALNAELAKGVNAVALDVAAETVIAGTINLPNTTDDVYLYILNDHSAEGNVINVLYTEGAAAHPKNLYIYAKKLNTLNGTVPDTHVEVYSYSHIANGIISTSGTTLVIQPFAYYGNLTIIKGALKVEGKIAKATLDPADPSVPINVTIVKDAEKDINGQIVILDVTDGKTTISTENATGGEASIPEGTPAEEQVPVVTVNVTSATTSAAPTNVTVNAEVTNLNNNAGTVTVNAEVEVVNTTGGGTTNAGEDVVEEEGKFVEVEATLDGVKYSELEKAFTDLVDNAPGTIVVKKMIVIKGNAGITIGKDKIVTLDLNGYTVQNLVETADHSQLFNNSGNFTVMDSSEGQTGVLKNEIPEDVQPGNWSAFNYATNVVLNTGTFVLKSGTLLQTALGNICYALDNRTGSVAASATLNGGVVSSARTAIRLFCNSTTKENNLTIPSTSTVLVESTAPAADEFEAIWVQLPNANKDLANVLIAGGTVKSNYKAFGDWSPSASNWDNVVYSIEGGKHKGLVESQAMTRFVKGGKYTTLPEAQFISYGCIQQNGDAEYPYEIIYYPWYNDAVDPAIDEENKIITISTEEEFAGLAQLVKNGNPFNGYQVNLNADLDLKYREWTPIGTQSVPFNGHFNGQNHTISNLFVPGGLANIPSNNFHGLFGYVGPDAENSRCEFKNVTIHNAIVSGSLYVGSLVGRLYVGKEISNINLTGHVEVSGWWYIGGISGRPEYVGLIKDCTIDVDDSSLVKGTGGAYVGGVAGFWAEGNHVIEKCSSNIDVTADSYLGGITGIIHYGDTIKDCSVIGATICQVMTEADNPDDSDRNGIGGIAGISCVNKEGDIQMCTMTGNTFDGYLRTNFNINHDGLVGGGKDGNPNQNNLVLENNTVTLRQ